MIETKDRLEMRPQPISLFALPAGYLVLPPCGDGDAASLMRGHADIAWPAPWQFYKHALEGDIDAALKALPDPASDLAQYNAFVLQSDVQHYAQLRLALKGELRQLLDVVAFTLGYINQPPSADDLDGELRALVLATHASRQIEMDAPQKAIQDIEQAIEAAKATSPLFAAQLLGQLASLRRSTPGQIGAQAIQHYKDALAILGEDAPADMMADLWFNLGSTYHELANGQRGALLEAVKCYQKALQTGIGIEQQPELYAMAHNNLALAYLAMPMTEASDQLRMAVAVQSLREALKVYQRETHAELWASTQLNLANALQYLPTSHPEDNLAQAVEIYEELLQVRNKAFDPVGYARLLTNQANALAHLGIFGPAMEKLNEAHKLFHWHNEPEMAASALELTELISEKMKVGSSDS